MLCASAPRVRRPRAAAGGAACCRAAGCIAALLQHAALALALRIASTPCWWAEPAGLPTPECQHTSCGRFCAGQQARSSFQQSAVRPRPMYMCNAAVSTCGMHARIACATVPPWWRPQPRPATGSAASSLATLAAAAHRRLPPTGQPDPPPHLLPTSSRLGWLRICCGRARRLRRLAACPVSSPGAALAGAGAVVHALAACARPQLRARRVPTLGARTAAQRGVCAAACCARGPGPSRAVAGRSVLCSTSWRSRPRRVHRPAGHAPRRHLQHALHRVCYRALRRRRARRAARRGTGVCAARAGCGRSRGGIGRAARGGRAIPRAPVGSLEKVQHPVWADDGHLCSCLKAVPGAARRQDPIHTHCTATDAATAAAAAVATGRRPAGGAEDAGQPLHPVRGGVARGICPGHGQRCWLGREGGADARTARARLAGPLDVRGLEGLQWTAAIPEDCCGTGLTVASPRGLQSEIRTALETRIRVQDSLHESIIASFIRGHKETELSRTLAPRSTPAPARLSATP